MDHQYSSPSSAPAVPVVKAEPVAVAKPEPAVNDHSHRLVSLLKEGRGVPHDVTFVVGPKKKKVKGHQFMLKLHSPVFRSILTETKLLKPITLRDDNALDFQIFLRFLYTGKLSETAKLKHSGSLLKYAIKYKVGDLAAICSSLLNESMSLASAVALYENLGTSTNDTLFKLAQDYILQNASELLDSEEFLQLSKPSLLKILASDDLAAINETQVWKALLRWGAVHCQQDGRKSNRNGIRSAIGDLVPLIRFPVMDKSDFSLMMADCKVLTRKELLAVLLYFNVDEGSRKEKPEVHFSTVPRNWFTKVPPKEPSDTEYVLHRLICVPDKFQFSPIELVTGDNLPVTPSITQEGVTAHQIKFMVDEAVWISSVGLNAGVQNKNVTLHFSLGDKSRHEGAMPLTTLKVKVCAKLLESSTGEVLSWVSARLEIAALQNTFQINFPKAIRVKPKVWYTLKVAVPLGCYAPRWYYAPEGDDGREKTICVEDRLKAVTMEFGEVVPREYPCVTGLRQGLIPSIGFKLDAN